MFLKPRPEQANFIVVHQEASAQVHAVPRMDRVLDVNAVSRPKRCLCRAAQDCVFGLAAAGASNGVLSGVSVWLNCKVPYPHHLP